VLSVPPDVRTKTDLPSVADSPLDGLAVSETLPAKPLRLMPAIVVLHGPPTVQLIVTGLEGCSEKSVT